MGRRDRDDGDDKIQFFQTLAQAREECARLTSQAMMDVVEQKRAVWPIQDGAFADQEHQRVLLSHTSVCHYASQVRPFRNELDENDDGKTLWSEAIGTISIRDRTEAVSLADLRTLESQEVSVPVEKSDELHGRYTETQRARVLLPVTVARSAFNQLDLVVKDLGFMPKVDRRKNVVFQASNPENYDEPVKPDIPKPQ